MPGEVIELEDKHHGEVASKMSGPGFGAKEVLLAIEADGGMSVKSPAELPGLASGHCSALVSGKVRPLLHQSARCVEGARIKVKLQAVPDG